MRILIRGYLYAVFERPAACLTLAAVLVCSAATGIPRFSVDASSDTLLFEADEKLEFYRAVRARYGSDAYLILTFDPRNEPLFSPSSLENLERLRADVAALEQIEAVVSILDVPLFDSSPDGGRGIDEARTRLNDPATDIALAREELKSSPLYRNRLLSADGELTALRLTLEQNREYSNLLDERAKLRQQRLDGELTRGERRRLRELESRIAVERRAQQASDARAVARVRDVMREFETDADLHLSGLPMINSDILSFIRHDLRVFGAALVAMLVALLGIAFRRVRWVVLPLVICTATIASLLGALGYLGWPVTVVSANFVALLLILTLSLNVHLAVRYRELDAELPDATARNLVGRTLKSKTLPALLTAVSTMVAFGSLIVSEVQPVIDFGRMMVLGLAASFVITFLVLPPALMLLGKGNAPQPSGITDRITAAFATAARRFPGTVFAVCACAGIVSIFGISRISLDNRFIDYFAESTGIHQGMTIIDRRLGGTTPLEVILDRPGRSEEQAGAGDDPLAGLPGEAGFATRSYWYDVERIDMLGRSHEFLRSRDHVGKVMSLYSSISVLRDVATEDGSLDNYTLSVIYSRLPDASKDVLFRPYISTGGDQLRIAARVHETHEDLDRQALLDSIRAFFTNELGMDAGNVHLTGLFVLYNEVLQGLLRSQVLTASAVFIAIVLMFALVFRSIKVAVLAIVPNLLGAAAVLAIMSALSVPLDIMTISIAAVAIGIGVDDTIHYVHRFREEFRREGDYDAAIRRSHHGVGRAMYYTTIVIVLGFSVLAFSSFVPTMYFGLLTGLAMAIALVADLTLLPALLARFRGFG